MKRALSLPLRGIREKLVVSFSVLIATIATFVFVFFPARLEDQAMRALRVKAEAIRDMAAYSVSAGMVFGDLVAVNEVLAGAARGEGVRVLVVRDTAGAVIASFGTAPPEAMADIPASGRLSNDEALYLTSTPILHESQVLGSLTVGTSLAELRAAVDNARRLGFVVGGLIFVVGLVTVYAISMLVTRPLTAVATTVRKIAAGDLELRAQETGDAEVAELVRAFNHMVDSLVRAQGELAGINHQLEQRVDARTSELRDAIAEQRRVQEALTQSESEARATSEAMQSLIDLAPQAIVAVDSDWNVTRWNRAAETLFGWSASEVLGRPIPFVPEEGYAEFRRLRERVIEDKALTPHEVVRKRKDGALVSVLLSTGAIRDVAHSKVGYLGVFTDLTERKSLEAQLRQSQKMEAVGRLAGGVAHDFNNLLTIITSCSALLLESPRAGEDREDIEAIQSAAQRAAALTRQLLLFSRKQMASNERVDLSKLVDDMVPMLRRLLRANIQCNTVLQADVGKVSADPTQLEQVILNLVVNASDAMPDGGVLTIETRSVRLDESYAARHAGVQAGSYIELVVTDTGIGMSAATMARIFEPFFTTKELNRGTGLGLATTYAVVDQVDGHIDVTSTLGHGTTFRLYFPQSEERTAEHRIPRRSSENEAVTEHSFTVLLVEDEDDVRRTFRRVLEKLHFTVVDAASGEAGLASVRELRDSIDIVLTDLMMPGMNGRQFVDRLHTILPEVPGVFMSWYSDDTVSLDGIVDERHSFLQKPFSVAQLGKTLQELLGDRAPAGASE